jgi:hypothetical protein
LTRTRNRTSLPSVPSPLVRPKLGKQAFPRLNQEAAKNKPSVSTFSAQPPVSWAIPPVGGAIDFFSLIYILGPVFNRGNHISIEGEKNREKTKETA